MTRPDGSPNLPLSADDPRISEWLDGRLAPAAAVEVARAVRDSPELTRLVNDLRVIRVAVRGTPVATPPAGFPDRVMASLGQRAEIRPDGRPPKPGAWLAWPALAGALAAGLVVAILLSLPGRDGREVALGPVDREAALGPANRDAAGDTWLPADKLAATDRAAAAAEPTALADTLEAGERAGARALTASPPPAAALRKSDAATAEAESVIEPRQAMAGVLAIQVRTAAIRQALDRLVAASGLEVNRDGQRLELIGTVGAIDMFLGELERAGMMTASRRRGAREALPNDERARLVLRIVEPKGQPGPAEPAGATR